MWLDYPGMKACLNLDDDTTATIRFDPLHKQQIVT